MEAGCQMGVFEFALEKARSFGIGRARYVGHNRRGGVVLAVYVIGLCIVKNVAELVLRGLSTGVTVGIRRRVELFVSCVCSFVSGRVCARYGVCE